MTTSLDTDRRPEAMADVPGVCELPLTRAVVQYRDRHEIDMDGGRIQDIGLALVLEGRYASAAEAVDLGSADVKLLDLSSELVVLDWVYDPTLEHVAKLISDAALGAPGQRDELARFSFRLALRLLERVGFGPLTRPTLLRIGFRDICRDLDLHDGTSVRIVAGPGRVVRTQLDYDGNALSFRTAADRPDPELEAALLEAFPHADARRRLPAPGGPSGYQVRLALPLTLDEARSTMAGIRSGLGHLIARFEPDRYRSLEPVLSTFGSRETLAQLHVAGTRERYAAVRPTTVGLAGPVVH
ncbi:MAG: hypothetical protein EXR95_09695 [Gemmatimonadetes bacterium]|nr:hypothetical protein [Gemmatimonadota bacterium]